MSSTMPETIATGVDPEWRFEVAHPVHGALVFTGKLPKAPALLEHRVLMDNSLTELTGMPSTATLIMAGAIAGIRRGGLIEPPVVREDREEDEDGDVGHVKVVQHFYDPEEETDLDFLADVWTEYSAWRNEVRAGRTLSAVGKSSATGSASTRASSEKTPAGS